jgi:hypothetical protein
MRQHITAAKLVAAAANLVAGSEPKGLELNHLQDRLYCAATSISLASSSINKPVGNDQD